MAVSKAKRKARELARKGRHGDTELLHISPAELLSLQASGRLTTNPETGLPEAFSLGNFAKSLVDPAGLFTNQGSSNPLAVLTSNVVNPGQLMSGVTPATVQQSLSANPFGSEMSYFDVLGGGAFAANPDVRKYGRLAGSAIGAYFAGPAIASELGGGAGAATADVGTSAGSLAGPATTELSTTDLAGVGAGGMAAPDLAGATADIAVPASATAAPSFLSTLGSYMPSFSSIGNLFGGGGAGTAAAGGSTLGNIGSYLSIGSGLYGMYLSEQQRKLAQQAAQMQDPFASQRGYYAQQLQQLQADPSGYLTNLPGYQAGIQAVNRGMAAGGYLGSGNQMTALQQYGGNIFNQEASRLANLAGAQFSPTGGQTLLQGTANANQLMSSSLGSIGYGVSYPQLAALLAANRTS